MDVVTPQRRMHHTGGGFVTAFYFALWGLAALLGASAVGALVWAIRRGEFDDLRGAASSIFDDEEPAGAVTDRFPGAKS